MKKEYVIAIIVAAVAVAAIVVGILIVMKKRRNGSNDRSQESPGGSSKKTRMELIDKSRAMVERNYKTCLAIYNLYKTRLSAESRRTFEEILPVLQYCSPSAKEVVASCDQNILSGLEALKEALSKSENEEKELEKILFSIKTLLADRSVEV